MIWSVKRILPEKTMRIPTIRSSQIPLPSALRNAFPFTALPSDHARSTRSGVRSHHGRSPRWRAIIRSMVNWPKEFLSFRGSVARRVHGR